MAQPPTPEEDARKADQLDMLDSLQAHWRDAGENHVGEGLHILVELFFEQLYKGLGYLIASPKRHIPFATAGGIAASLTGLERGRPYSDLLLGTIGLATEVVQSDAFGEEPIDDLQARVHAFCNPLEHMFNSAGEAKGMLEGFTEKMQDDPLRVWRQMGMGPT